MKHIVLYVNQRIVKKKKNSSEIVCVTCNLTCRSKECYDRHKERVVSTDPRIDVKSPCEKWWKCVDCKKVLLVKTRN